MQHSFRTSYKLEGAKTFNEIDTTLGSQSQLIVLKSINIGLKRIFYWIYESSDLIKETFNITKALEPWQTRAKPLTKRASLFYE